MPRKGMPAPTRGKGRGVQWIKDNLNHTEDECLPWPFGKDDKGYGTVGYLGKLYRASRLMCIFKHGDPPTEAHQAAHSCGNGHLACTHPEHVFWRTPQENRIESNEHGTGNLPAPRRLTLDQVNEIRLLQGKESINDIAPRFNVHPDTIAKIFRGETWRRPRSTLTRDQISRLKDLKGTMTVRAMAAQIGVKESVAYRFFRRQTFTNVNS